MTFKLPILIFFLCCLGNVFGQTFTGKVIDAVSKEPLIGANIVNSNGQGTTTDVNGLFSFSKLENFEVFAISFIGYETLTTDTIAINKSQTEPAVFELIPSASSLGEIVISAGKFEQRLEEVTMSLDILKPSLIEDKNQVRLENTLQQAPGVNVTDGQANIRGGSGWSFGTGTRVQTLVDGIPLISGDAGQALWDLVPIQSLDRVEVLKGASSVLYGSAAMNGVIHAITHPFPEKFSLNVNLYSGWYDTPKRNYLKWWDGPQLNSGINFDLQQIINPNNAFVLSAGYISDDGFRYLEEGTLTRMFGKYLHKSKRIKGLEASLSSTVNYADHGDALMWESDSFAYIPGDSAITRTYGWDFYIDPNISYRHGHFKHNVMGRYLQLNNNAKSSEADYTNASEQFFLQYLLQYYYTSKLVVTAGYSTTHTTSNSIVFVGRHQASNNAGFLQADYKPLEWINLNAGVRLEEYTLDDRYQKEPVFRGGVNVQIIKGTNARFSYGEAFRFPAISETFTTTSFGAISVFPNEGLNPESGNSIELGLRQMFYSKKIKGYIDFSVFQMHYYDMIEFTFGSWGKVVPPGYGLGFKPLNVGETKIKGFEVATALEGKVNSKLAYRLLAGYTYTLPQVLYPDSAFAQDQNGNDLTYTLSSSDTSNRILKYRYQDLFKVDLQINYSQWHGGFSMRYNDFMQNIDRLFNDRIAGVKKNRQRNYNGDFVLDVRLGYQINKKWQVDFLVNNVLNEEFMIRPGYLGEPRSYTFKINYSIGKS